MCELNLGPLEEPVVKALRSRMAHGGSIIGVPDQTEIELEFRLFAIGDTQSVSWDQNPADILHMMYHFHKQPKGFTGGGVRLFDGRIENGMKRPTASFRDVEIGDNNLLIFPETSSVRACQFVAPPVPSRMGCSAYAVPCAEDGRVSEGATGARPRAEASSTRSQAGRAVRCGTGPVVRAQPGSRNGVALHERWAFQTPEHADTGQGL